MCGQRKSYTTPLCKTDPRTRCRIQHVVLICPSTSVSGRRRGLASLKKLMLCSMNVLFIGLTRIVVALPVASCSSLTAAESPVLSLELRSYQPPFRSTSLAGITSLGSPCICPELGLDLFFFPFLPGCCHPLTCGCALALSDVCCDISFVLGLRGEGVDLVLSANCKGVPLGFCPNAPFRLCFSCFARRRSA